MKLYYPITIDLYKVWPLPVMTAQQNNVGRGAAITLVANGAVVTPDEEAVNFYARRPDGHISYLPARVDGAKIYCDFTNQMLSKTGRIQVEIQMIGGSEESPTEITTPIFLVDVQSSNIDSSVIEGQNEFTALQRALAQVGGLKPIASTGMAEDVMLKPITGLKATNVQEAFTEQAEIAEEIKKLKPIATSGLAADVAISPIAGMTATNVQGALSEQYSKMGMMSTNSTISVASYFSYQINSYISFEPISKGGYFAIAFPTWFTINSTALQTTFVQIPPGEKNFRFLNFAQADGTLVTEGNIDISVLFIPIKI